MKANENKPEHTEYTSKGVEYFGPERFTTILIKSKVAITPVNFITTSAGIVFHYSN
jgi:hypothetical protein